MNKKLRAYLQYVFFIALAGFFVWLSLRNVNAEKWEELKNAIAHARLWVFFPVLFLLLLSHWIRALRWKMLIEPLGYNPSSINTFFGVMVGYFVNLGAPRLGEIIKCTVLARYEKIRADKLVGTIVAERAFDLLSLILVFFITMALEFDTVGSFTRDWLTSIFISKEGKFSARRLFIFIGSALLIIFALRLLFTRFLHINFVQQFKVILKGIWHGLTSIRLVKNKFLFLFYTVLIWALYVASTLIGFDVLDQTSNLGIGAAFSALVMGSIGMIFSPGGIGAYPWFIQQTVLLYGIPEEPYGQALGWLLWLGQFIIFVLFGALSFILLPTFNKKKNAETGDN
ncbi:MAG TPA: lysylphosphatidylglycerol synthase transmembrane domain-containing protein [Chitinophagaceae bacterium]|nr:lysylphosphatidylglycerol synthase transmembrane domain-containing protein [Chitinophagaceae bacterium]